MSSQEESKLSDLQPLQSQVNLQLVQWLWQSDADPWKEKDSTKWKWTSYPSENSNLIESSFSNDQKTVDLGGYEIDLNKMLQVNKKDRNRIRRIKREVNISSQSRFMLELPMPVSIEKIQQTINPAFGTVHHFLDFIMKRTHETYELFQRLKELNLDCKQDKFQDVIQEVIRCIQKAAESNEKVTKSRGLPGWKSPIQEAKKIMVEIETKSQNPDLTLRDFLKMILKAYTEESFVCYWLNELLRSENWVEINVLTPYLVCLVYTFQVKDYIIQPQGLQRVFNFLFKSINQKKLMLYRGTALTKQHLEYYRPESTTLFSWNAVTSTSRSKKQALNFIRHSLAKTKPGEKLGVLFIIEADLVSDIDGEGMIDISANSKYPYEKEVILSPGSVFEVKSCQQDLTSNVYKVKLALKKKFEDNHEILGDFQAKVISKTRARLIDLDHNNLIKALQLIEGNQLIHTLEIEKCEIDSHMIELIDKTRQTTNITEDNILIHNSHISVHKLLTLCYYFPFNNLRQICLDNNITLKPHEQNTKNKKKNSTLKKLFLDKSMVKALVDQTLFDNFCQEIPEETQITDLNAAIGDLLPSKSNLTSCITCIQKLSNLKQLSLDFESSRFFSDETLKHLQEALQSLKLLTFLSLNFAHCAGVTKEGMKYVIDGIQSLEKINHLSLNFAHCENEPMYMPEMLVDLISKLNSLKLLYLNMTDFDWILEEKKNEIDKSISKKELTIGLRRYDLRILEDALKSLRELQKLKLNFDERMVFSDEEKEVGKLINALKSLTSPKNLDLEFGKSHQISGERLVKLISALTSFNSLDHLQLAFAYKSDANQEEERFVSAITSLSLLSNLKIEFNGLPDQGIDKLASGFKTLNSLTHLHLDFRNCYEVSDEGLDTLASGLKTLNSLTHLHLDFGYCYEVSDEGLDKLASGLKTLNSLTHLHLDFGYCEKISAEGLYKLARSLKTLNSLTHLHLNFGDCNKISDEGLDKLASGLKTLNSLAHLHLGFRYCDKISNGGLDKLASGLKTLNSLTHLHLDFGYCNKISGKGLDKLANALNTLNSLIHLHLDFGYCYEVSDEGLDTLASGLKTLNSLTHLHLNFESCKKISDEGLDKLASGLKTLNSLTHLHLDFGSNFEYCTSGLNTLNSLTHLHLDFDSNFEYCKKISDEGLDKLASGLKTLNSLAHLHLDFRYCKKISDEGLDKLASGLKILNSLTHLHLDFEYCKKISNEGIGNLAIALKPLTTIRQIQLSFHGCSLTPYKRHTTLEKLR